MSEDIIKNVVGLLVSMLVTVNTLILWSMRDLVKKHEQTLYGVNGGNGHDGDIKTLRRRTHAHSTMLTEHSMRLGTKMLADPTEEDAL